MRSEAAHFGIYTQVLLVISTMAPASAIACAGLCLWSLHGKGNRELARLGINPGNPDTYKPAGLWYFGHIARLDQDIAVKMLCRADQEFETKALAHNAVDLARKVFCKHRWVNAGWALTALALITFAAAGISFFVQVQHLYLPVDRPTRPTAISAWERDMADLPGGDAAARWPSSS